MSGGALIGVLVLSIALVVLIIVKFKMNPAIALILGSLCLGFVAGIPMMAISVTIHGLLMKRGLWNAAADENGNGINVDEQELPEKLPGFFVSLLPILAPVLLILLIGWFLGVAFRQITGSGTVASLTTFAIMQSVAATVAIHPVFIALACLDGALFGATVNDSGFWIVSNMAGLNFSGGVKTYTLGQAIASVVGIILIVVVGCISCLF